LFDMRKAIRRMTNAPQAPGPPPRGFLPVLALSMGVGPLAIYAVTATAPLITADLGLSRAQLGSFATVTFLAAAVTSAFVGRAVDAFSGRVVLTVLFVGSGLALAGVAAAGSYRWLLVALAVSGVIQALSNPVTNQLVAAHVPAGRRGGYLGLKQSGVQMSQLAAGLALPSLALALGWRGAAAVAAAVALVAVLLVRGAVPSEARPAGPHPGRRLADLPPALWWLTGYIFVVGAGLQATNVYLPLFSFERLDMSVQVAGLTAAVVGCVGLVSRIAWGRAAERVRDPHRPLLALAVASALAVTCLLGAEQLAQPALLWLGAALFGASAIAANVVVMLVAVRLSPYAVVGTATGIVAVGLYLGFALGPVGFGLVVDRTGSYTVGWLAVLTVFAVAAGLVLVWRSQVAPTVTPAEVR
jgi:predicted MFS family arabinose efflux permease